MSIEEGEEEKARGQAWAAAKYPEWTARAREVAIDLASRGTFTAEDVIDKVGFPAGQPSRDDNGAVGSLFSALARGKQIEWTGRMVKCTRTESHASDLRVWQAYSGFRERQKRVYEIVEEWMVPNVDTKTGRSTKSKAERYPALFAAKVREAWGDIE